MSLAVQICEDFAKEIIENNPNMSIPWWLMASYAYYGLYKAIITDGYYDKLSKFIADNYDTLQHWHKELINKDTISTTGFDVIVPERTKYATYTIIKKFDL
jgi:hypothetical protein